MSSSDPILEVSGLTKRFGGLTAVNDMEFSVRSGELIGLIGPNGAGKTTLFNLLMGLIRPNRGEIVLQGRSIVGMRPHNVCALGMVKTFQNVALFPELSVMDNVLTGGLLRFSVAEARAQAAINLKKVGMHHIADKRAADLTFPEKALVEMARALCTQPRVVLLDEVMAALNDAEMDEVLDLIRKLRSEEGLTFLVIEHHMRAIMNLCDRILAINFGQKIAEGTPAEIARHPEVISAYLGQELAAEHAT
jgi:branched-chain amino acid transport system ATP-binding protein